MHRAHIRFANPITEAAVCLAVIKSAASAASPEGFPSRDPAGCQRGLPAAQNIFEKYFKHLSFLEGFLFNPHQGIAIGHLRGYDLRISCYTYIPQDVEMKSGVGIG